MDPAKNQDPPKGGPISQINHGSTPAGAGNMDHGQSSVPAALAGKFTNNPVPVKIGSYPETGVPGQANKA